MPVSHVTLRDIYMARQKIASIVKRTPLIRSPGLTEQLERSVYLKLENVQETGAFKIRGAANKLLNLTSEELERGVVTVSSGNHGRALAYVASRLGSHAVVCMTEAVPEVKREAIRKLGAELFLSGNTYKETLDQASQIQKERGLVNVHPFDDPLIIAGQGTIGLELLEDLPEIDSVIVPLSGGGLLGGIALALKSADAGIRTIGVSMERNPAMVESLRAGKVVEVVEEPSLADALIGGIAPVEHTFDIIQKYVDETVLVSEKEIAEAMIFAFEKHHLVVEGGGAVGLAALLFQKVEALGQHVAVVISGGNVDPTVLIQIVHGDYNFLSQGS